MTVMENREFLIPLNGLASGGTRFRWKADGKFFDDFGNADILDADIVAEAVAVKNSGGVRVDCSIIGTVTVQCDRCMDDLVLPVDTEVSLKLRYNAPADGADDEDGCETVSVSAEDHDFDMRQTVYDYVCVSLPMQRFHNDGECNPEMIERLDRGITVTGTETDENPFESLRELFPEKK